MVADRCQALPLIVRTASDARTLRDNARAVRKLPRNGIHVAIEGLSAAAAENFKTSVATYVRACGCAEGAATAFAVAILLASALAWRMYMRGPRWTDVGNAAEGMFAVVVLAGLGKFAGLLVARWRFERSCNDLIRMIDNR